MRNRRDQLTLATIGWGCACLAFLVLGILTPVDMRYYLTAIPALAVAAGIGSLMDGLAAVRHGSSRRVFSRGRGWGCRPGGGRLGSDPPAARSAAGIS